MRMADTRIERLHHAPRLPETVVAARVPKVLAAATRLAPRGRGTSDPAAPPVATSPPRTMVPESPAAAPIAPTAGSSPAAAAESAWSEVATSFGLSDWAQAWLLGDQQAPAAAPPASPPPAAGEPAAPLAEPAASRAEPAPPPAPPPDTRRPESPRGARILEGPAKQRLAPRGPTAI